MICAAGLFVGFVCRERSTLLVALAELERERESPKPISVKSVSAQLPAVRSGKKSDAIFSSFDRAPRWITRAKSSDGS
jgi:hypothetical protein